MGRCGRKGVSLRVLCRFLELYIMKKKKESPLGPVIEAYRKYKLAGGVLTLLDFIKRLPDPDKVR